MASGTEIEVLKAIKDEGGETTVGAVAHRIGSGWGMDYIHLLCSSLGRADYIDVLKSGKLRITTKGEKTVESK